MSKRGASKSIRYGTNTNSTTHVVSPKTGRVIETKLNPPVVKARSPRNTSWNGVDNNSGKWKGHATSGSDSVTSAGIGDFDIQGRGFQEVQDLLSRAGNAFTQMAQDAIAKGAAEGRKKATLIEEKQFTLGKVWTHAVNKGALGPGSMWQSASRFDPRLGGYRGVSSGGNALRLINFNFKAGHTYRDIGDLPGTIEARVTSQLANLFENDATWRRNSPVWTGDGGKTFGRFGVGAHRKGRHYFSQFYRAFDEGLLIGITAAEKSFNDRLNKNAKKETRAMKKLQKGVI